MDGGESNKCGGSEPSSSSLPAKKVVVRLADMSDDMLEHAIEISSGCTFLQRAFEKHTVKEDVAEYIKKMFDKFHGPSWHCIVGNFGSYISHEKKQAAYFSLEETTILLYKSGAIVN